MFGLINLRHMAGMPFLKIPRVGRMTLLRTLQKIKVGKEQGCELKQLGGLNQLRGKLSIAGLENVETQQEALEAKLGDKEGLTTLQLSWGHDHDVRGELKKQEAHTEVLEGLCPPKHLESLTIYSYHGLRYPSWMMGEHGGGPKYVKELSLFHCSTELGGFWPHLRSFYMYCCSSSTMPDHMEHLTSLRRLDLDWCPNIRSLPTLPRSLDYLSLTFCHEMLMSACRRAGDPNWEKFQHVPYVCVSDLETT
ncbi:unnamed protein product [Triticum turgidum subsp. durum]|uniref:R13L1/DRL21-like LRR repeat region domain-containing protein n=1 Tax=Triticum turgidum subsp. durum TaxID=4567 RepID=A0A9R0WQ19_TRITD|nr:unnamed protein product [Triticum turgidum subsp. durum]